MQYEQRSEGELTCKFLKGWTEERLQTVIENGSSVRLDGETIYLDDGDAMVKVAVNVILTPGYQHIAIKKPFVPFAAEIQKHFGAQCQG